MDFIEIITMDKIRKMFYPDVTLETGDLLERVEIQIPVTIVVDGKHTRTFMTTIAEAENFRGILRYEQHRRDQAFRLRFKNRRV